MSPLLDSKATSTLCTHCGLPVPPGLEQFCCEGCRTVFQVLHQEQMEDLYAKTRDGREAKPAASRSYEAFDDPTFLRLHSIETEPDRRSMDLYVEGVHCAACVWLLEGLPRMVPGVYEARLHFARSMLTVTWNPRQFSPARIAGFLDRLGYPPHPYRDLNRKERQRAEDRQMLIRIGVAGAVAGNVMGLAFALYGGMFDGMSDSFRSLFRWTSLLLTLPSVFWAGNVFFKRALSALRMGRLHLDLPISVGIAAGFVWGIVNTIRNSGEVYFDSISTLIFLLLLGRWLQHRQQRRASQATEVLYNLAPATARRCEGNVVREVPVEALQSGDRVEVRAGDTLPVDGEVVSGTSDLDRSTLTGESRPVSVGAGEVIHAGTVNLTSALIVRVTATGSETRIGQLLRQVEELAQRKAPLQRLVDRIAGVFVAVVLSLATVTTIVWSILDPPNALEHAIALLVVSCPCALGMATPLAFTAALGRAARRGILVKGGEAIETLSRTGTLLLDKTGTLTAGSLELVEWTGDEEVKPLVAAIESCSSHPIARALCRVLPSRPWGSIRAVQRQGLGIAGEVEGVAVTVGAPDYVMSESGPLSTPLAEAVRRFVSQGLTPVAIARNHRVVAVAGLGDPLRPDVPSVLDSLREQGWRIGILSGDHPDVVAKMARRLKLDPVKCLGGQSPEDKLRRVREAQERGPVVMVGDGVNDAAALSAATVGIAVHGGAEASLAVADVFFTRPEIGLLTELFQGASRTMRVLRRTLAVSLFYNIVGVSLAALGWMNPVIAAILMPLSSLSVIWSSYHSRSFRPEEVPCR